MIFVKTIREAAYGPELEDPEITSLRGIIADMKREHDAYDTHVRNMIAKSEDYDRRIRERLANAESRLKALEAKR